MNIDKEMPIDDVELSSAQVEQIDNVYDAVAALVAVMTLNYERQWDIALYGPIADMVSMYLADQGQVVAFPSIVTDPDDTEHIEDTYARCRECQCETAEHGADNAAPYIINEGFSDQHVVCFSCHTGMMERCEHTACDACGSYFTANHLLPNKDNEENGVKVREICPYCGEIWCE